MLKCFFYDFNQIKKIDIFTEQENDFNQTTTAS